MATGVSAQPCCGNGEIFSGFAGGFRNSGGFASDITPPWGTQFTDGRMPNGLGKSRVGCVNKMHSMVSNDKFN